MIEVRADITDGVAQASEHLDNGHDVKIGRASIKIDRNGQCFEVFWRGTHIWYVNTAEEAIKKALIAIVDGLGK